MKPAMITAPVYYLLLIWFGLASPSGTANADMGTGLPGGLCASTHYQCDNRTHRSWSGFLESGGIEIGSEGLLAVGQCSRNGKWNHQVYVLLALRPLTDDVYFDARVSFYNNLENFYQTPASQISTLFPDIHQPGNRMTLLDSHAYIDYSDSGPFRYWLRYNKPEDKMLMVAYFGFKDTFLCEFES